MTTAPVTSITDELLAELESIQEDASAWTPYADAQEYLGALAGRSLARIADMKQQIVAAGVTAENCEVFRRDAERLDWMFAEQCIIRVQNGTGSPCVYSLWWSTLGEGQREWHSSPREAIDAAMEAAK